MEYNPIEIESLYGGVLTRFFSIILVTCMKFYYSVEGNTCNDNTLSEVVKLMVIIIPELLAAP